MPSSPPECHVHHPDGECSMRSPEKRREDGPPWLNQCSQKMEVDDEIAAYLRLTTLTESEKQQRYMIRDRVEKAAKELWGKDFVDVKVVVYGSMALDLAMPLSDIDMTVTGVSFGNDRDQRQLQQLAHCLSKRGMECEVIPAKVPVVKVTDVATGIRGDITFAERHAVQSVELLNELLDTYKPARDMIKVIKMLLRRHNFNEASFGGLNSFSVNLLVVCFLQMHQKWAECPEFHCCQLQPHQHDSVGMLLFDFFMFFGKELNHTTHFFIPYCGKPSDAAALSASSKSKMKILMKNSEVDTRLIPQPTWQTMRLGGEAVFLLVIQNPLDRSSNCAKGAHNIPRILRLFRSVYSSMKSFMRGEFDGRPSLLSCILPCDEHLFWRRDYLRGLGLTPMCTTPSPFRHGIPQTPQKQKNKADEFRSPPPVPLSSPQSGWTQGWVTAAQPAFDKECQTPTSWQPPVSSRPTATAHRRADDPEDMSTFFSQLLQQQQQQQQQQQPAVPVPSRNQFFNMQAMAHALQSNASLAYLQQQALLQQMQPPAALFQQMLGQTSPDLSKAWFMPKQKEHFSQQLQQQQLQQFLKQQQLQQQQQQQLAEAVKQLHQTISPPPMYSAPERSDDSAASEDSCDASSSMPSLTPFASPTKTGSDEPLKHGGHEPRAGGYSGNKPVKIIADRDRGHERRQYDSVIIYPIPATADVAEQAAWDYLSSINARPEYVTTATGDRGRTVYCRFRTHTEAEEAIQNSFVSFPRFEGERLHIEPHYPNRTTRRRPDPARRSRRHYGMG